MAGNENLDPMDLRNLTFVDLSKIPIPTGPVPGWDDKPDYDTEMKDINTDIYYGVLCMPSGIGAAGYMKRLYARLCTLLDIENEKEAVQVWREIGCESDRIADLLVTDAVRNDTRNELPDALQACCGAIA